jgi:hypothetical protein
LFLNNVKPPRFSASTVTAIASGFELSSAPVDAFYFSASTVTAIASVAGFELSSASVDAF